MIYAQIDKKTNQVINKPTKLPERWTTHEGATINYFNKLSRITLQTFNWLPVVYEELTDGATHNSQPVFDKVNQQFIFEAIPQDINILIKQSEYRIDEAASFASKKYISQGVGQDARYLLKYRQAIDYIADIPINIDKYIMIKREAELSGISYDELAFLIIETTNDWINIAAEIEALRCSGKKKCKKAKDVTEIIQFRDITVLALESI